MTERYIHVRNFGRFQRFQDRRPSWIRLHLDLVENDAFAGLTDHQQAVLIAIWIAYARRVREDAEGLFRECRGIPESTSRVSRLIRKRVLRATLETLNHAGFIEFLETETVTLGDGSGSLEVRSKKLDKTYARARKDQNHTDPEASPQTHRKPWSTDRKDEMSKPTPEQYATLRERARQIAATWNGTSSDTFEATLDQLQIDVGARLTTLERDELWDTAFKPAPATIHALNGDRAEELPYDGEEPPVVND